MPTDDSPNRTPKRRRGDVLEAALLDSAWEEIVEKGYDRFTIESVAERARTSRDVIYRRWPGKAHGEKKARGACAPRAEHPKETCICPGAAAASRRRSMCSFAAAARRRRSLDRGFSGCMRFRRAS